MINEKQVGTTLQPETIERMDRLISELILDKIRVSRSKVVSVLFEKQFINLTDKQIKDIMAIV